MSRIKNINELRNEIDKIDKEIWNLLDRRMQLAFKIGQAKGRFNQDIFVPEREKQIEQAVLKFPFETISADDMLEIQRKIIETGRKYGRLGSESIKQSGE